MGKRIQKAASLLSSIKARVGISFTVGVILLTALLMLFGEFKEAVYKMRYAFAAQHQALLNTNPPLQHIRVKQERPGDDERVRSQVKSILVQNGVTEELTTDFGQLGIFKDIEVRKGEPLIMGAELLISKGSPAIPVVIPVVGPLEPQSEAADHTPESEGSKEDQIGDEAALSVKAILDPKSNKEQKEEAKEDHSAPLAWISNLNVQQLKQKKNQIYMYLEPGRYQVIAHLISINQKGEWIQAPNTYYNSCVSQEYQQCVLSVWVAPNEAPLFETQEVSHIGWISLMAILMFGFLACLNTYIKFRYRLMKWCIWLWPSRLRKMKTLPVLKTKSVLHLLRNHNGS